MFVEEIRLGVSVGREDGLVSKYEIILMFLWIVYKENDNGLMLVNGRRLKEYVVLIMEKDGGDEFQN
jgi:hypothetical protein